MHVERAGRAGPALLLLHGFGHCAYLWRALLPELAGDGFTVLAPDLLGHGESSGGPGVPTHPGAQVAALERLLTALRLTDVQVVGQDLGGLVALLLAAEHPRRTSRIALLEPLDPSDLPGDAIRSLQRTSALNALGANSLFGARPLLESLLRAGVTDEARMPERLVARYLAPFVGGDGMQTLLHLASSVALAAEEAESLREVAAEVAIWVGGSRSAVALADWRRVLPQSRVVSIADDLPEGALVAEQAPDRLLSALRSWLT
jgi:pimeloyl-ACP methyl ester carboxylesterase